MAVDVGLPRANARLASDQRCAFVRDLPRRLGFTTIGDVHHDADDSSRTMRIVEVDIQIGTGHDPAHAAVATHDSELEFAGAVRLPLKGLRPVLDASAVGGVHRGREPSLEIWEFGRLELIEEAVHLRVPFERITFQRDGPHAELTCARGRFEAARQVLGPACLLGLSADVEL